MRETLHKQMGREAAAALREAAQIITPGAWWDGEPPNAHHRRRVAQQLPVADLPRHSGPVVSTLIPRNRGEREAHSSSR